MAEGRWRGEHVRTLGWHVGARGACRSSVVVAVAMSIIVVAYAYGHDNPRGKEHHWHVREIRTTATVATISIVILVLALWLRTWMVITSTAYSVLPKIQIITHESGNKISLVVASNSDDNHGSLLPDKTEHTLSS